MKRIFLFLMFLFPAGAFAGPQPIVDLSTTTVSGIFTNLNQANQDSSKLRALLSAVNIIQQYVPLAPSEIAALIAIVQTLGDNVQADTSKLPSVVVGP